MNDMYAVVYAGADGVKHVAPSNQLDEKGVDTYLWRLKRKASASMTVTKCQLVPIGDPVEVESHDIRGAKREA